MERIKLSLLIPVFNEGVNLKIMLKILKATVELPHETLIVYDFPEDDSIPVAKSLKGFYPELRLVHNTKGRGVINAIKSGVEAARSDYILLLTADDMGPLLSLEEMVNLMDSGCDLVSATRYAYGGRAMGGYLTSRFLSRTANTIFRILVPSSLTDSTIGIKMFRKSMFKKINLCAKPVGWACAFELAIKAQLNCFKLGEVPITSINRFYGGKSSFKLGAWFNEYVKWFFWGIKEFYWSGRYKRKIPVKVPKRLAGRGRK
jgi:glycosyltransferase involved in cell wall biosynthesis